MKENASNIKQPSLINQPAAALSPDYTEKIKSIEKKLEFLLEQNYLKDELLIQLDEKIENQDG